MPTVPGITAIDIYVVFYAEAEGGERQRRRESGLARQGDVTVTSASIREE